MKPFEKLINEQLGELPVASPEAQGKFDMIQEIMKDIASTKDKLASLELDLRHATEELNLELAKELRKRMPKLAVSLNDGRCSANYRSTNLSCKPNLQNGLWDFEPNKFGRSFTRRHGPVLRITNKVDPLVDAMISYFGKYKSLNDQ